MKHLPLLLAATLALTFALAAAPEPALAERRALKEYRDTRYPIQLKALQEAAGGELVVEVDWNALALPGEASNYLQPGFFEWTIFGPLAAALREIHRDAAGRDAFRTRIKKIVVVYDEASAPATNYANGVSVADGVLRINFRPWSNADDEKGPNFKARQDAIRAALEKAL